MTGPAVGVVGASGRAAVMSLARAGYTAWAVDLFADRDLRRVAPVLRCPADRYPEGLPGLCDGFPPRPVLYTGGLENYPEVVRELARRRPLWGNGPEVLRRVRDPFAWAGEVGPRGFAGPRQIAPPRPVPPSGRWLRKPLASAGGRGVRFAPPGEAHVPGTYVQEYIDGPAMSAQFVSAGGRTVLLGVTDQLVGEPWLHARPFAYCGAVGPSPVSGDLRDVLSGLAGGLARWGHLRGVWGIDFVLRGGLPCPVEINPRYTAGLEVLEYGCGFAPLADHAAAFGPSPRPPAAPPGPKRTVGKAIYYAPRQVVFPGTGPWEEEFADSHDPWRLPAFADVPEPGGVIEPGWPVLTVFATGDAAGECRAALRARAAELDQLFG